MKYLVLTALSILVLSFIALSTSTACSGEESCIDRLNEMQRLRSMDDSHWINLLYTYCDECASTTSTCLQSHLYR